MDSLKVVRTRVVEFIMEDDACDYMYKEIQSINEVNYIS